MELRAEISEGVGNLIAINVPSFRVTRGRRYGRFRKRGSHAIRDLFHTMIRSYGRWDVVYPCFIYAAEDFICLSRKPLELSNSKLHVGFD